MDQSDLNLSFLLQETLAMSEYLRQSKSEHQPKSSSQASFFMELVFVMFIFKED